MSDDRDTRALAAGELFEVDGAEYRLRPVSIQYLADLQNDALRFYKRQYIKTYTDNDDLLGESKDTLLQAAFEKMAEMTVSSLPTRRAFSMIGIPVTPKLREYMAQRTQVVADMFSDDTYENTKENEKHDDTLRALVSNGLDIGDIEPGIVESLCDKRPRSLMVRYDEWWVTGTFEGQAAFIAASLRSGDEQRVPTKDVLEWPMERIAEASRLVENLTSANLGNT